MTRINREKETDSNDSSSSGTSPNFKNKTAPKPSCGEQEQHG
jgi:hypothetical protein